MRLIDADALIDELGISDEDIIFEGMLVDAPTIDAVPVVRCKDCKWSNVYQVDSNFPMERWCDGGFIPKSVQDYDYCSWGERKDDETD